MTRVSRPVIISATLSMLLAAMIWGFAFVPQKTAAEHLGPFSITGIRFLMGALTIGLFRFFTQKQIGFRKEEIRAGCIIGVFLTGGAVVQQAGVALTTAGKAGFITGLYLLFVPIFLRIFWKQATTLQLWIGIVFALWGLYLLSIAEAVTLQQGDFLVLLCSVIYSFHIIFIGLYAPTIDPTALAVIQALFCGIVSLAIALFVESPKAELVQHAWQDLFYLGVLSAGIAFTIQIKAQKYLSTVIVGLLCSLESIFAALGGAVMLNEILSQRQIIGCGLILVGVTVAQLKQPSTETA